MLFATNLKSDTVESNAHHWSSMLTLGIPFVGHEWKQPPTSPFLALLFDCVQCDITLHCRPSILIVRFIKYLLREILSPPLFGRPFWTMGFSILS